MRKVVDNHPPKGSKIKVDPIRNLDDLEKIKEVLAGKPRDYCLFVLGINNGLRISDLLNLKVRDVQRLKPGDSLEIRKHRPNQLCHEAGPCMATNPWRLLVRKVSR